MNSRASTGSNSEYSSLLTAQDFTKTQWKSESTQGRAAPRGHRGHTRSAVQGSGSRENSKRGQTGEIPRAAEGTGSGVVGVGLSLGSGVIGFYFPGAWCGGVWP